MKPLANFTSILLSVLLVLTLSSCASNIQRARTAYGNEDYQTAKKFLLEEIRFGDSQMQHWGNEPNPTRLAENLYMLGAVHARLREYEEMRTALDSCIKLDGNFTKRRRELLESYSVYEFNQAVAYYNNFFFKKSVECFERALIIMQGLEIPPEYEAVIYRGMLFSYVGDGDLERAISYCRKATALGDGLAKRVLEQYEREKKIDKPEKLEPRQRNEPKVI
jgi:tetratricopeptide (TPR) repeat protein